MRNQSGYALMVVMMMGLMVMGLAYGKMITQNAAAIQAHGHRVAIQMVPAIYALMDSGIQQGTGSIDADQFYSEEYLLSSSYQDTLMDAGFDSQSDENKVVMSQDSQGKTTVQCTWKVTGNHRYSAITGEHIAAGLAERLQTSFDSDYSIPYHVSGSYNVSDEVITLEAEPLST